MLKERKREKNSDKKRKKVKRKKKEGLNRIKGYESMKKPARISRPLVVGLIFTGCFFALGRC